jgi:hypothetical protein
LWHDRKRVLTGEPGLAVTAIDFSANAIAKARAKAVVRGLSHVDLCVSDAPALDPPGDMENRIKECQLDLYADRTSTATIRANQLRLWFASMAYALICALRRIGLHDTDFATATCGTIRLKLLKIGAIVRFSVRRIKIAMASACPAARDWLRAAIRLALAALARASPA